MDRFSSTLLVAMAVVLLGGLGWVFYSRDHQTMETADPAVNIAKVEPTPSHTDPRLLFAGSDISPSTTLPVAVPTATALPMSAMSTAPLSMAAPATAMPTP